MLGFWPTRRQARRWETRNRSCRTTKALRRRSGLRNSLGKLLQHRLIELSIGQQSLEAGVLQLELLEALGTVAFMPP